MTMQMHGSRILSNKLRQEAASTALALVFEQRSNSMSADEQFEKLKSKLLEAGSFEERVILEQAIVGLAYCEAVLAATVSGGDIIDPLYYA